MPIRSSSRRVALAALLAILPAGAALAAPGVFEGCQITSPRPDDRAIQCQGILASVSHGPANVGAQALLEAAIGGVRAGFKGKLTAEPTHMAVGGKVLTGVRYRAFSPREPGLAVLVGRLFAAPDPRVPDRIRIVGCGAATAHQSGEETCEAMLVVLHMTSPAPTEVTAAPAEQPTRLAGREIAVPKACSLVEPRRIRCAEAELHWRTLVARDPEGLDWIAGPLATAFQQIGKVSSKDAPCAIEGSPGACRAITVTRADGKSIYVTVGTGKARGERVMVQCNSNLPFSGKMPAPCASVLQ